MISISRSPKRLHTALCSLVLAGSASLCIAQGVNDYVVDQFDDGVGTRVGAWAYNYGGTPCTIEYDATQNRGPGANPGAMKVTVPFNLCTGNVQCDFEGLLANTLDLTTYTKLHFSVKVDTSSSHLSDWGGGAFGNMRLHIRKADWADANMGTPAEQWVGADAYGAWVDYTKDIDQTLANLPIRSACNRLGIDIWSGWGSCAAPVGHTNTVVFWLDNIWFEKNTNTAPVPPPIVDLKKSGPAGVQITMDDNGSQWQRDAIASPASPGNCLWNGFGATPVTYSFTIAEFPDPAVHPGFEAHMYLVNSDTAGGVFNETYGGCDWNAADIAIVSIIGAGGGGYNAQFQMKTNRPNNNPINDITNIPAVLHTTEILGTWSLSFTYNTNVTLSGPGGFSTNFFIGEDAVLNNFSPVASFIQFGFHKNDGANDGHNNRVTATYSHIKKVGGDFQFDDTFNGATYTNNYPWRKTSASAVQHIPSGTAWLLNWTVPAVGFYPQSAATVTGPWTDISGSTYQSAAKIHVPIPAGGSTGYFRLIKRPFTKLQVLLPGETAAPNTVSGKTGTPDAQSAGVPFVVTVNAVDAVWNVVSSSDVVSMTSTDTAATDGLANPLPSNVTLSSGTATFTVTLNTSGSWTIKGTDTTDGTKTPGTSTAITIP